MKYILLAVFLASANALVLPDFAVKQNSVFKDCGEVVERGLIWFLVFDFQEALALRSPAWTSLLAPLRCAF